MGISRGKGIFDWLRQRLARPAAEPDDIGRARQLIAAIDRGGIPLNPARLNSVARDLGLEVSRHAAPEETIARIRAALARSTAN